jgi:PAS domain S-box-containing protein
MKHRNGHWVWPLETGAVHKWDEVGRPFLMSGTHQDITERKLAEEKIKESEERFRLMADTAPVLIWMSGSDSLCNYFNKSWINFTGRTLAEEIGEGWMKNLHPNDFTNCIEIYNNAIKVQKEFKMEFRLMSANGEYGWLINHAVPRFENDGTFLGYIGSCVDITVSKKLQITLEKYTKDLEISNTELENFAFVASHDLKEPLRMVNSYLRLLEIKLGNQLDEKTSKYIHYASDGSNRMKILIDNLLQYSSVSSNKDPFIQLDLNEELNYIQLILKDSIKNNNAVLHIHTMPKINTNKTLINELFINIINNALKYRDEKDPIIEVGYKEDLDSYVFYIKDNGIGIKEEDFSKIFILFSRLHNKNTYSGTGIGLAHCKKIVEIHKGKIWLESEVGVGSTFYFSIPINKKTN